MSPTAFLFTWIIENGQDIQMKDVMRRSYYWPYMVCQIYTTVTCSCRFARNGIGDNRLQLLQLFPVNDQPEFIAKDFLGLLRRTLNSSSVVLLGGDCFQDLASVLRPYNKLVLQIFFFLMDRWVVLYYVLTSLLTKHFVQFVKTHFKKLCTFSERNVWILRRSTTDGWTYETIR